MTRNTELQIDPDLTRFTSKAEVCNELIDNRDRSGVYPVEFALELAVPWGFDTMVAIHDRANTFEEMGVIPYEGYSLDTVGVGAQTVIKVLVQAEGREAFSSSYAGSGFRARADYKGNLALLLDEVDGVSPRDFDADWRSLLRNDDREVEGVDDEIDASSKSTQEGAG